MPPVDRRDEPIDIVARPVRPDGSVEEPQAAADPEPERMEVAFPGPEPAGSDRAEVRYWRFETVGDDGCGCGGCGCLTALVMLLGMLLLRGCTGFLFR